MSFYEDIIANLRGICLSSVLKRLFWNSLWELNWSRQPSRFFVFFCIVGAFKQLSAVSLWRRWYLGAEWGGSALNLDRTAPLFIAAYSADHCGLQWVVSSYCRCCFISAAKLEKQGERALRIVALTANNLVIGLVRLLICHCAPYSALAPACVAH